MTNRPKTSLANFTTEAERKAWLAGVMDALTMLDCDFDQIGEREAPMMRAFKGAGKRLIAERRKMLRSNFN